MNHIFSSCWNAAFFLQYSSASATRLELSTGCLEFRNTIDYLGGAINGWDEQW